MKSIFFTENGPVSLAKKGCEKITVQVLYSISSRHIKKGSIDKLPYKPKLEEHSSAKRWVVRDTIGKVIENEKLWHIWVIKNLKNGTVRHRMETQESLYRKKTPLGLHLIIAPLRW